MQRMPLRREVHRNGPTMTDRPHAQTAHTAITTFTEVRATPGKA
jgi:hypothetical protein